VVTAILQTILAPFQGAVIWKKLTGGGAQKPRLRLARLF